MSNSYTILVLTIRFDTQCIHSYHPQSVDITILTTVWILPITHIEYQHHVVGMPLIILKQQSGYSLQRDTRCQTNAQDLEEKRRKHQHMWVLSEYECVLRETKGRVLSEGDNGWNAIGIFVTEQLKHYRLKKSPQCKGTIQNQQWNKQEAKIRRFNSRLRWPTGQTVD